MDELLTTAEAARLMGKPHSTVRGYVRRDILAVARRPSPRLTLVRRSDVERLIANPPKPGPKPRATTAPDATA